MGEQERPVAPLVAGERELGRGDLNAFLDGPTRLVMLGVRAVLGCDVAGRARDGDGWT